MKFIKHILDYSAVPQQYSVVVNLSQKYQRILTYHLKCNFELSQQFPSTTNNSKQFCNILTYSALLSTEKIYCFWCKLNVSKKKSQIMSYKIYTTNLLIQENLSKNYTKCLQENQNLLQQNHPHYQTFLIL